MLFPKGVCGRHSLALAFVITFATSHAGFAGKSVDGQMRYIREKISLEDVFRAMFSDGDASVMFHECTIVIPEKWLSWQDNYNSQIRALAISAGRTINNDGQVVVKKEIVFSKNRLESDDGDNRLTFTNFFFEKSFNAETTYNQTLFGCTFANGIYIFDGPDFWFEDCTFRKYFVVKSSGFGLLAVKHCMFDFDVPKKIRSARPAAFDGSEFLDTIVYKRRQVIYGFDVPGVTISADKGINFLFEKNTIKSDSINRFICQVRNLDRFSFFQNDIDINFSLQGSMIGQHANITSNIFRQDVSFTETVFPQFGNKIDWSALSGRLIFLENFPDDDGVVFAIAYSGKSREELGNDPSYLGLMKIYQQFNQIYKTNGDINAANSCYAEMKDIEGLKLQHDYSEKGGFQSYFRWKLNRLMKFYTQHGTDPARAIVMSIWIILSFAVFYFFFPSEWDTTSKREIVRQFRDFIGRNDKGYFKPFIRMTGAFLISFINAFTLSLNSFTTLGFGNIPTAGLARYICVVEGFVGWFLLSIFTVALINQVSF